MWQKMSQNKNAEFRLFRSESCIRSGILTCILLFFVAAIGASTVAADAADRTDPTIAANPDEDLPIEIQSDSGDFDDKSGNATHRGNVVVNQGTRHLTAEKLIIHRTKAGKIDIMTAYGDDAAPVRFEALPEPNKPKLEGEAKIMKYFPHEDKIILLEEASLTQNNHTVRGPVITYFLKTRVLSSESDQSQRTTVIINPKEKS